MTLNFFTLNFKTLQAITLLVSDKNRRRKARKDAQKAGRGGGGGADEEDEEDQTMPTLVVCPSSSMLQVRVDINLLTPLNNL